MPYLSASVNLQKPGIPSQNYTLPPPGKLIKYLLISFLCAGLSAFAGLLIFLELRIVHLILCIFFIIAGVVHFVIVNKELKLSQQDKFLKVFLFLILLTVINTIGFIVFYYLLKTLYKNSFNFIEYVWILSSASLLVIVPFILHQAFHHSINIPDYNYKKWFYPNKTIVPPDNVDKTNFAIITFIFSKKYGEKHTSNLQSKAPYGLKLGDLFYFFIQEWNFKHAGDQIEFVGSNQQQFGWYFIVKKKWWNAKRYLDPELTIEQNSIKVNEIIVTERVLIEK